VDGAVYDRCGMGVANVNTKGYSVTRNVTILNSRATGFLIIAEGKNPELVRHELANAVLLNNPTQVSGSRLKLDNVLIAVEPSYRPPYGYPLQCGGGVEVRRTTITYGQVRTGTEEVKIADSVLACGFHVRADDPLAVLRLSNIVCGRDGVIEWGSKPPWKRSPIADWLTDAAADGAADNCRVSELNGLVEAVLKHERPTRGDDGAGCDEEVWGRLYRMIGPSRQRRGP